MQKADPLEKTLMLGKTEGQQKKGAVEDEMVRQHIEKQKHDFTNKDPSISSYGFSSSHVRM